MLRFRLPKNHRSILTLQVKLNHTLPAESGRISNLLSSFLHGFGVCPLVGKIDSATDVGFDGASEMFYVLDEDISQGRRRIIPMQGIE